MLRIIYFVLINLLITAAAFGQSVTKLYVPSGTGSNVTTVLGLESQTVINQVSSAFEIGIAAANADSSEIWLFGEHSSYCNVINGISDRIVRTIDLTVTASDVAFTPDGKLCFVIGTAPDKPGNSVMAIDCATKEPLYLVGGFTQPSAIVTTPDSRFFYVASYTDGLVIKVSIPSFQVAKTIAVGPEPVDLALSADGKLLFVACQGLDNGKRGGSQVSVINTETDKLFWIFTDIGVGPQSIAVTPDLSRLVLTYREPQTRPQANVRVFQLSRSGDNFTVTAAEGYLHGASPAHGVIFNNGSTWIGCDKTAGPLMLALGEESSKPLPAAISGAIPMQIGAVRVDVDAQIRSLEATMATSLDSLTVADSYLDLAYLYATAGRKNEVVATYNKVISAHPQSLAAITAGARMGDITFEQALYGQTAEYSMRALDNYADYLMFSTDKRQPQQYDILNALNRLAKFSKEYERDYLNRLAEKYLKVSARNPILAEFYFTLGYNLQLQNDSKLAKRCFVESQAQIPTIQDRLAMLTLTAKLALVTADIKAFYKIRDRRDDIVIDGNIEEWQKQKALTLTGDEGYVYGPALWSGVNDLSASFYMAASKEFLYIAGNVIDNSLLSFPDGKGDAVTFYLDMRPEAASYFTRNTSMGDGCFTITINAMPRANLKMNVAAAYEIAGQQSATGHSFEAKIPLAAFGKWYSPSTKRIGLGIEIIDFDTAENAGLVKSLGFLLPTREPFGPVDPSLFGVAEF